MEYTTDLIEILNYIDPSRLDYQEWCCVGMALKYEGYSVSEWDSWSRRDSKRYHDKECLKKIHSLAPGLPEVRLFNMQKIRGGHRQ